MRCRLRSSTRIERREPLKVSSPVSGTPPAMRPDRCWFRWCPLQFLLAGTARWWHTRRLARRCIVCWPGVWSFLPVGLPLTLLPKVIVIAPSLTAIDAT